MYNLKLVTTVLLVLQTCRESTAILYIVRQACNRGAIFTPVPSTVNNICLQCKCVMADISYCKLLAVNLSVICSATAIGIAVPTTTTTAAPTVPAATTLPSGINPRASTAAPAMMVMSPVMVAMMMAGTGGGAGATTAPGAVPARTG